MSQSKEPELNSPLPIAVAEESKKVPVTREELVVVSSPSSQQAEQFRALRNSLHALNPDGAPRTVVLTSALRGEGKTTATLNLAFALAEMPGFKVLVIDANLQSPGIEGLLGLPRAQGLCELLSGRLPLDQAVRPSSVPGVAVLGPGSRPKNPSELLASDRMRTLLRTLKQRYHYVLIDTPEATTTSDANLLAAMADGALVVVRVATTPKSYVEQTCRTLESLGANLLGTCLTCAEVPNTAKRSVR